MGSNLATELASGEFGISTESAIALHLQYNHYPAIPTKMVEPCLEAIRACIEGNWHIEIPMPEGVSYKGLTTAPAWAIIEQHHLDAWIEDSDD